MLNTDKPDDANAVLLSSQNALKRCKGTNIFGIYGNAMIILASILSIRKKHSTFVNLNAHNFIKYDQ